MPANWPAHVVSSKNKEKEERLSNGRAVPRRDSVLAARVGARRESNAEILLASVRDGPLRGQLASARLYARESLLTGWSGRWP